MEACYFKFKVLVADPQRGCSVVQRESSPQAAHLKVQAGPLRSALPSKQAAHCGQRMGWAEAVIVGEKARPGGRQGRQCSTSSGEPGKAEWRSQDLSQVSGQAEQQVR